MPANLSFDANQKRLTVQGELTFATVMDVLAQSLPYFEQGVTLIDLAQVIRVDSAGLALFCEWYQLSVRHPSPCKLQGVCATLTSMMTLHGVEDLFA